MFDKEGETDIMAVNANSPQLYTVLSFIGANNTGIILSNPDFMGIRSLWVQVTNADHSNEVNTFEVLKNLW